jgi:hypothetical protein
MQINHQSWVNELVKNEIKKQTDFKRELQKQSAGNNRQDESRPILESLLSQGYDTVTWNSNNSMHGICREINNQQWTLEDFLSGLMHDAPIFERTHPGDNNCIVIVTGPEVPPVSVDSYGNVENI